MINILNSEDLKNEPEELQKIFETLFSQGKSLRSKLVCTVGSPLSLDNEALTFLCRIVEYIHNSSLLHDDVLDRSQERRNSPAAWLKYSPEQAVLAGDYLLTEAIESLVERGVTSLLRLTIKTVKDLVKGEFLQRELIKNQNENLDRLDVVSDLKTASLFKLCLISPFLLAHEERNQDLEFLLNSIGYELGLLFQRSDDLLDFSIRNKEGKINLVDLSQNYLNSFSCFVLANENEETKAKFRRMKNPREVHSIIKGFEDKLKKFDELNENLIQTTESKIQSLTPFLSSKEKGIIKHLKQFPKYFYYRDDLNIQ